MATKTSTAPITPMASIVPHGNPFFVDRAWQRCGVLLLTSKACHLFVSRMVILRPQNRRAYRMVYWPCGPPDSLCDSRSYSARAGRKISRRADVSGPLSSGSHKRSVVP
jgi:hypothetical protein